MHKQIESNGQVVPLRTSLCKSQCARHPIGWRHCKPLRLAQMLNLRLLESTARDKARPEKRPAALAAAARRWLRPAADDLPTYRGRAASAETPATTIRTFIAHLSQQSSESRRTNTRFQFFSARGRRGERGGSAHTSAAIVVELSRKS